MTAIPYTLWVGSIHHSAGRDKLLETFEKLVGGVDDVTVIEQNCRHAFVRFRGRRYYDEACDRFVSYKNDGFGPKEHIQIDDMTLIVRRAYTKDSDKVAGRNSQRDNDSVCERRDSPMPMKRNSGGGTNRDRSKSVWVGGLPEDRQDTLEDDLRNMFKPFGLIESIKVCTSEFNSVYAYINFWDADGVDHACQTMDGSLAFSSVPLRVRPSIPIAPSRRNRSRSPKARHYQSGKDRDSPRYVRSPRFGSASKSRQRRSTSAARVDRDRAGYARSSRFGSSSAAKDRDRERYERFPKHSSRSRSRERRSIYAARLDRDRARYARSPKFESSSAAKMDRDRVRYARSPQRALPSKSRERRSTTAVQQGRGRAGSPTLGSSSKSTQGRIYKLLVEKLPPDMHKDEFHITALHFGRVLELEYHRTKDWSAGIVGFATREEMEVAKFELGGRRVEGWGMKLEASVWSA